MNNEIFHHLIISLALGVVMKINRKQHKTALKGDRGGTKVPSAQARDQQVATRPEGVAVILVLPL
jgi:hypothetical protein